MQRSTTIENRHRHWRKIHLLHFLPAILALAALILAFLCLFAGAKPNFMSDYAILTVSPHAPQQHFELQAKSYLQLNTSRIGQNLVQNSSSSSSNPIINFLDNNPLTQGIENEISQLFSSIAKDLGIADFYSAYILDHCEGTYIPAPVPNATLPRSKIKANVTSCSNRTAFSTFDPTAAIQTTLDKTKTGIKLADLDFPKDLEKGIVAFRDAFHATFILYCLAIGFAFLVLLFSVFLATPSGARLRRFVAASLQILLIVLTAMCLTIASVMVTIVTVKGTHIINKYGHAIGVSGSKGNGFLALTWAATGCMVLAALVCQIPLCFGGSVRKVDAKYG
jgi:hypothetical protein